jgi:AraC family transcriptional regulator of adaptative response/methylated-DNA-[protein]-cysteine methyltransferase
MEAQEAGGAREACWHNARMSDYERIARIIRLIEARHGAQPSLEQLAAAAGLSAFHFHRLFSRWAGITPKDFLQCLTLAHARAALRAGASVMEAAFEAGLSGPGRLHDLAVSLEAASPGEIKSGGAGWQLQAGFAQSPFGECLIAQSPRGVCHLSFSEAGESRAAALARVAEDWPNARIERDDPWAIHLIGRVFSARPATARRTRVNRLRVLVHGSTFQVRVWRALVSIAPGTIISYGSLAGTLGMAGAARAVGSAVARNNIAYLIPCHRVIRETGVVGEYRWGHERKRALLAWEGARAAG